MYKLIGILTLLTLIACNNRPAAHDAGDLDTGNVPADANATLAPELFNDLRGRWQSVEDPKNIIVIQDSRFINYYDGAEVSNEELQVFQQCEGPCAAGQDLGDMACFMTKGETDTICYALVSLDEQNLEYSMIGGAGNTLQFKRVEE